MSDLSNGYIKLHRSLLNWEWYDNANTTRLFIHCLLSANHKDNKWHGITIPTGSFITSRAKLANSLKLSERKIRTALNDLQTTNELTIKTTSRYSIITVNNWDLYQQNDQQIVQKRPTDDQPTTTNKNDKNEKNEKNIIINVDDDVSKNQSKNILLDDVPEIIKKNKNIKNPCAYWAMLPDDAKERLKNQKPTKANSV